MTSSNIKQRQIIHLSNQLTILLNRSSILESNLITTSEQASYINLLGAYHTAWFMACGKVMTPKNNNNNNEYDIDNDNST